MGFWNTKVLVTVGRSTGSGPKLTLD